MVAFVLIHKGISLLKLFLDMDTALSRSPRNSNRTADVIFGHALFHSCNGRAKGIFIRGIIHHHKFISANSVYLVLKDLLQLLCGTTD